MIYELLGFYSSVREKKLKKNPQKTLVMNNGGEREEESWLSPPVPRASQYNSLCAGKKLDQRRLLDGGEKVNKNVDPDL